MLLLLLLSRFSRVRLCVTPETPPHQAPPSLGFSRQEYWSGLPFPSPMHAREKWKWSHLVVSDSSRPHGLQPTRLLRPWIFQARVLEWGAIAFSNFKNRAREINMPGKIYNIHTDFVLELRFLLGAKKKKHFIGYLMSNSLPTLFQQAWKSLPPSVKFTYIF